MELFLEMEELGDLADVAGGDVARWRVTKQRANRVSGQPKGRR